MASGASMRSVSSAAQSVSVMLGSVLTDCCVVADKDFKELYSSASATAAKDSGEIIKVLNPLQGSGSDDDEDEDEDEDAIAASDPFMDGKKFNDVDENIKQLEAVLEEFEGEDRVALESRIATLKQSRDEE